MTKVCGGLYVLKVQQFLRDFADHLLCYDNGGHWVLICGSICYPSVKSWNWVAGSMGK